MPPPIAIIALPWPWSVPRFPFSLTARPNSDIVKTTVSSIRSPRSVTSAARPRLKSSSLTAANPELAQLVDRQRRCRALQHPRELLRQRDRAKRRCLLEVAHLQIPVEPAV